MKNLSLPVSFVFLCISLACISKLVADPIVVTQELSVASDGFDSERRSTEPPFRIMLDAGHGGKPEGCSSSGGAHWDPDSKKFLSYYRFGAAGKYNGKIWTEESIVMWLARKILKRLNLLSSPEGRKAFSEIVERVTGTVPEPSSLEKGRPMEVFLARDNSYLDHPERSKANVNQFFRLFDSPSEFPVKESEPLTGGRLSKMVSKAPELTVCLHVNGAAAKSARGIHCLFVPSYYHFEKVRKSLLGEEIVKDKEWYKVNRCWFKHTGERSRLQWMYNDTWTYFTGYGSSVSGTSLSTDTDIGSRYQDLQWKYKPQNRASRITSLEGNFHGPFWERERSAAEKLRRHGGLEGYGGDNLYAGMELVRYSRLALYRDKFLTAKVKTSKDDAPVITSQVLESYLGPEHRPVAADWAVPLFSNAVTAFLEIGYITNSKDFEILRNKLDVIADGITVGIFSLVNGLQIEKDRQFKSNPRGKSVGWKAYQNGDQSSYFKEVLPSS
jgi:N-acetylmuramoyl-L-alanine amidase